jgi:hypothetical protein
MWVDEHTNRLIQVEYWMPIPIAPNEWEYYEKNTIESCVWNFDNWWMDWN